tara:strand:- start:807 stop:989 length:183 start_codon:yes stop_codon:yes gene_type:complete
MTLWYLIVIGIFAIIAVYIERKNNARIQAILDSMPEGPEKEAFISDLNSYRESFLYYTEE